MDSEDNGSVNAEDISMLCSLMCFVPWAKFVAIPAPEDDISSVTSGHSEEGEVSLMPHWKESITGSSTSSISKGRLVTSKGVADTSRMQACKEGAGRAPSSSSSMWPFIGSPRGRSPSGVGDLPA